MSSSLTPWIIGTSYGGSQPLYPCPWCRIKHLANHFVPPFGNVRNLKFNLKIKEQLHIRYSKTSRAAIQLMVFSKAAVRKGTPDSKPLEQENIGLIHFLIPIYSITSVCIILSPSIANQCSTPLIMSSQYRGLTRD